MAKKSSNSSFKLTVSLLVVLMFVSVFTTSSLMRSCFADNTNRGFLYKKISKLICGTNVDLHRSYYRRLGGNVLSAESNVHESEEFSVARGSTAKKLIDGSKDTRAAPASRDFDYTIGLTDIYSINKINLHWGDDGKAPNYIDSWKLEASIDGQNWEVVDFGGFPKEFETSVNKDFVASMLRLSGHSEEQWIGVNEVEIIGKPIQK
ncbi:TPA: hypothetical protein DGT35_01655 [Patescibacteria group bacterium]|nr:hypothetical protein [Patescibacteria group bacterium]|tara:strand:- start:800 stop:1417 length:618 start_codon:yes stop_codon:yes gene_type:complete